MTFSLLNCEKDPLEQGYEAHSFDVIIASNVLHATEFLERTMSNVRKLLKPGGYLCLLECTGHLERTGFLMAGLPGWWLGGADGRPYRPTISPDEWDVMLRKTGFSGVDSIINDFKDKSLYTVSVIVTQAVNEDVLSLRQPLQSRPAKSQSDLIVIGGATPSTKAVITSLRQKIPSWSARKAAFFVSWEDTAELTIPFGTTVLSIADLDEPVFKSMNAKRLKGIQTVINSAASVLWVTTGCKADEPYSNMAIGMRRSIVSEMPHLHLQFLDVDSTEGVDTIIGETLVRLELAVASESHNGDSLWSIEPEMIYENGQLYLLRVKPIKHLNDQLNSTRRVITKEIPLTSRVVVNSPTSGDRFELDIKEEVYEASEKHFQISVKFSSLFLLVFGTRYVHLCVGTTKNGESVLAFSMSNESVITVPRKWTVLCDEPSAACLQSAASYLLAKQILESSIKTVLLHDPSVSLVLAAKFLAKNEKSVFSCSNTKSTSSKQD